MWQVWLQHQDQLHRQCRDRVGLLRVRKSGRPWADSMLKTLGHSTPHLLHGSDGRSNMGPRPLQRWRCQTIGPFADHKEPRVSNHAKDHHSLEDHRGHRTRQYNLQYKHRNHLRHCALEYQSSSSASAR